MFFTLFPAAALFSAAEAVCHIPGKSWMYRIRRYRIRGNTDERSYTGQKAFHGEGLRRSPDSSLLLPCGQRRRCGRHGSVS